ncbi:MAG TPA: N-acetylmuramoyl-L-alanine amidase [Hyphomicrobiaceae bacterium]|nr:N-acetylmuramoyl-L-alanine amidase [Hyphomicrobiaceae bacterium]
MAIVVLDPGHGGTSMVGGSSANNAKGPKGTLEKHLTLKVAKAAQSALEAQGVDVRLTRTTDVNLGLAARAAIAKAAAAPVFLSIHFNGFNNDAQGTETLVAPDASDRSRKLAKHVQSRVRAVTGLKNRGVKDQSLGVLRPASHHPKTAAALLEVSFMDVAAEEERLQDRGYITAIGTAIADAIVAYLVEASLMAAPEVDAEVAMLEDGFMAARRGSRAAALELQAADDAAPVGMAIDAEIPFIEHGDQSRSFGDIGRDSSVDDPEHMTRGWRSYRNDIELTPDFEAVIGQDKSLPATFLQVMADRRRAVGKISASGVNYRGQRGSWSGTGFVVGKNLLLTNHHVLNSADVAQGAVIDFEFELPTADFLAGVAEPSDQPAANRRRFKLDPARLFVTSPATEGGLDYTFVWVDEAAVAAAGPIPMHRANFAVNTNEQAFVVHHPEGRAKRVSLDDTDVLIINTAVIRYTSDTMPGSSGSPVFNRQGRLIALHHASRRGPVQRDDGRTLDVLNEGVKISAIVLDLERRHTGEERAMIGEVLAAVHGSDTMSGFFGALGREREARAADTSVEAVVDAYRGTEADIDIGFWNIEWLSKRYTDRGKLRMAAALIVDLGLDIWGLSEVSPSAVKALVGKESALMAARHRANIPDIRHWCDHVEGH